MLIQLQSLNKTYETPAGSFAALRGVDLTIEAGEFVAVVGKSGSGEPRQTSDRSRPDFWPVPAPWMSSPVHPATGP